MGWGCKGVGLAVRVGFKKKKKQHPLDGHVELQWGPGGGRVARFRVPTCLWGHEWSACMLVGLEHSGLRLGEGYR